MSHVLKYLSPAPILDVRAVPAVLPADRPLFALRGTEAATTPFVAVLLKHPTSFVYQTARAFKKLVRWRCLALSTAADCAIDAPAAAVSGGARFTRRAMLKCLPLCSCQHSSTVRTKDHNKVSSLFASRVLVCSAAARGPKDLPGGPGGRIVACRTVPSVPPAQWGVGDDVDRAPCPGSTFNAA